MKKKTREQLLDAAIVVLARNPGAPLNEIADAAGVGRATLYRYFPSRDDLIRELILESYQQTTDALQPVYEKELSSEKLLLAVLEASIPLGDRFYFLLRERSFEEDSEIHALYEQDENDWYALFEQMKGEGLIAADVSTAWVVATMEALIYTAWVSAHEGYIASRDAAKLVYRTLMTGVGPK